MLLGSLIVISIITTLLGSNFAGTLRGMISWAFAPAGDGLMYIATSVKAAATPKSSVSDEQVKNHKLYQMLVSKNSNLIDHIIRYRRAKNSAGNLANKYLCKKFGVSASDLPVRLIPGRVILSQSLPYGATRSVNVGSEKGALPGRIVTTRNILTDRNKSIPKDLMVLCNRFCVGKVSKSSAYVSQVVLVTDKSFQHKAQIKRVINRMNPRKVNIRNRIVRLTPSNNRPVIVSVRGDGAQSVIANDVPRDYAIKVGDFLQTLETDENMPAALTIGKVVKIENEKNKGRVKLIIRPIVNLSTLRNVNIVVPTYKTHGGSN